MAPDRENFRGVHAVRVLTDVDDLTLDGLIELAYDPYLPGFETLIPGLIEAWDRADGRDAGVGRADRGAAGLEPRNRQDSVAMSLAHFYGMNYLARQRFPEG